MPSRHSVRGLDAQDRELLSLLREDARLPTAALARELGVARTTVVQRLKRLERDGIVGGYTVRMSSKMQANTLRVHVLLSVDAKKGDAVIGGLRGIPQVRAAYAISGAFDALAFVECETTDEIDKVLDQIGALPGVQRTQSSLVLSVKFDRQ
ncbi:MAG: Lrp/AsnC family transcriptional regulator [Betaproteobacteria bacterium]